MTALDASGRAVETTDQKVLKRLVLRSSACSAWAAVQSQRQSHPGHAAQFAGDRQGCLPPNPWPRTALATSWQSSKALATLRGFKSAATAS